MNISMRTTLIAFFVVAGLLVGGYKHFAAQMIVEKPVVWVKKAQDPSLCRRERVTTTGFVTCYNTRTDMLIAIARETQKHNLAVYEKQIKVLHEIEKGVYR